MAERGHKPVPAPDASRMAPARRRKTPRPALTGREGARADRRPVYWMPKQKSPASSSSSRRGRKRKVTPESEEGWDDEKTGYLLQARASMEEARRGGMNEDHMWTDVARILVYAYQVDRTPRDCADRYEAVRNYYYHSRRSTTQKPYPHAELLEQIEGKKVVLQAPLEVLSETDDDDDDDDDEESDDDEEENKKEVAAAGKKRRHGGGGGAFKKVISLLEAMIRHGEVRAAREDAFHTSVLSLLTQLVVGGVRHFFTQQPAARTSFPPASAGEAPSSHGMLGRPVDGAGGGVPMGGDASMPLPGVVAPPGTMTGTVVPQGEPSEPNFSWNIGHLLAQTADNTYTCNSSALLGPKEHEEAVNSLSGNDLPNWH